MGVARLTVKSATATVREAERKVKEAVAREAVARNASASAAKAQVNAEAAVIRLKMQISQSREGANISDLAFDRPAVAHAECNASIEELIAEMAAIRKSNEDARLQIHELETVLRARTQDITQLGQTIISVFKGEISAKDLGVTAANIAKMLESKALTVMSQSAVVIADSEGGKHESGSVQSKIYQEMETVFTTHAEQEDREDASVPIDSAFYGVDAGEVTWEEPLSVRKNKPRPEGMPSLALDRLAPPPDDPDAAMLEFAYEQQYGKEEAKRLMKEAKNHDVARVNQDGNYQDGNFR